MGKKEKERKQARRQAEAEADQKQRARATTQAERREIMMEVARSMPEFRKAFSQGESVPLTDELIDELVEIQGMPKKDLLDMRKQGLRYCASRNSFISPPEINLY